MKFLVLFVDKNGVECVGHGVSLTSVIKSS